MKNPIRGFTLIELLVVIAIIGILAGFIIASMGGAQGAANDARRKADINQLSKAVMIYKTNNPDTLLPIATCTIGGSCTDNTIFGTGSVLKDPDGSYYTYSSTDGNHFIITSKLSNTNEYVFDSSTGTYSEGLIPSIVPIDGVCGVSAGVEHDNIPSAELCSAGNPSGVSGDGVPYTWTCDGVDGGVDVSCTAVKTGWIDTGLGFYVMKYEAKVKGDDNGNQAYVSALIPESRASGTPWVNINQVNAIDECASLGTDYHLITVTEWTSLARSIAAKPSNWSGGAVGNGFLSRGYSASTTYASDGFMNTHPALTTGALGDVYNTAANTVGPSGSFMLKRIHDLPNGNVVWDLVGNIYEWNSNTCNFGSGAGKWYNIGSYTEWNDSNLSDYERGFAGPNPLYTSTHYAGKYYGCIANGNGIIRGGMWYNGLAAGLFALQAYYLPTATSNAIGFRCVKSY
ncbi:MAG: prepilin-type N-terminal cleavage/methylation domain-containing protein [Candidatus Pacebacteria bacterium]|nr:prepilin-type N-terminal cleavage/methylation domain-containing protein [Candidatus Paceibacterota bacterium]